MAPWPSGKAELCKSFTPSSNLGGASKLFFMLYASQRIAYFLSLIFRGIAQLVEQRSPKPRAEGSSPSAPATYGITFVYQAKVILFLCTNRIATRFLGLSEVFQEVLFFCEIGKKSAKIFPDQLMLQKKA